MQQNGISRSGWARAASRAALGQVQIAGRLGRDQRQDDRPGDVMVIHPTQQGLGRQRRVAVPGRAQVRVDVEIRAARGAGGAGSAGQGHGHGRRQRAAEELPAGRADRFHRTSRDASWFPSIRWLPGEKLPLNSVMRAREAGYTPLDTRGRGSFGEEVSAMRQVRKGRQRAGTFSPFLATRVPLRETWTPPGAQVRHTSVDVTDAGATLSLPKWMWSRSPGE